MIILFRKRGWTRQVIEVNPGPGPGPIIDPIPALGKELIDGNQFVSDIVNNYVTERTEIILVDEE